MWQAVDAIDLKLAKVLLGTESKPPRWRKCLKDAVGKKYISAINNPFGIYIIFSVQVFYNFIECF